MRIRAIFRESDESLSLFSLCQAISPRREWVIRRNPFRAHLSRKSSSLGSWPFFFAFGISCLTPFQLGTVSFLADWASFSFSRKPFQLFSKAFQNGKDLPPSVYPSWKVSRNWRLDRQAQSLVPIQVMSWSKEIASSSCWVRKSRGEGMRLKRRSLCELHQKQWRDEFWGDHV